MHTASDVAKWFLCYNQLAMDDSGGEYISNLKLQKLLYYAQGSFLAMTDAPLFSDSIYAWTHGPVVPSVYHEYKENDDRGILPPGDFDISIFTDEETELLIEVYFAFGQFSAWKLRNMTHEEAPWRQTELGQVIDIGLIKDYFKLNYVGT